MGDISQGHVEYIIERCRVCNTEMEDILQEYGRYITLRWGVYHREAQGISHWGGRYIIERWEVYHGGVWGLSQGGEGSRYRSEAYPVILCNILIHFMQHFATITCQAVSGVVLLFYADFKRYL
jgi:hypothetical protein